MAGWSSGKKGLGLAPAPSPYAAHIADCKAIKGQDPKTKEETDRFQWGVDIWIGNQWVRKSIFTGTNFCDLSNIRDPQFIPNLVKLVRACGLPVPQSADEARAWHPNTLIGQRFGVRVEEDSGIITERYVRLDAQQPQAAPVQQAPAPAPQAQPAQYLPPQGYAPAPPAAQPAPPQYAPPPAAAALPAYAPAPPPQQYVPPSDPFQQPAPTPAAAGVAGAADPWA